MVFYLRGVGAVMARRRVWVEPGQAKQRRRAGQVGIGRVGQLTNGLPGLTQVIGLIGQPGLDRAGRGVEQPAAQPLLPRAHRGRADRRVDRRQARRLAMLERIGLALASVVAPPVRFAVPLAFPTLGHPAPRVGGVRRIGLALIGVRRALPDLSQNGGAGWFISRHVSAARSGHHQR